jgi:hypothetical protein
MTSTSNPTTTPSAVVQDPESALINQLSVGPDFREVATYLLRQPFKQLYPDLDIDPASILLGTPSWDIVDDEVVARSIHYQPLTEILARQAITGMPSLFIDGEHFLTQMPITEPVIHLPVAISGIANMLNLLAPVMPRAFQEQQLAYWNDDKTTPRWHELSSTLSQFWNVEQVEGWTSTDCAIAKKLFEKPVRAERALDDAYESKAYMLDIDEVDGQTIKHLNKAVVAVLTGMHEKKPIILAFSLHNGYQKFDSLDQLGAALPDILAGDPSRREIQWRLWEPDGNFFDHQACAIIATQLDIIGTMNFLELLQSDTPAVPVTAPSPSEKQLRKNSPDLAWYQSSMPDWLREASSSDLNLYARYLKDLAALHSQNQGKSWQDDIPSITQYTQKTLKDEMTKDHVDAAQLNLEEIEIRVRSPVVWGTFAVPGKIDTQVFNLVDLALQNLIALPLGTKTLRFTTGKALPDWMTVAYLETIISRVDIGSHYPTLLKDKLLDIKAETAKRRLLYAQHLQIQLPLLALQCKIRGESGIDERGQRYIAAVMKTDVEDRQVDGQVIVMRPLAFAPKLRTSGETDVVSNMFVIGPQDMTAGPCILYRPMLDEPLSQFPSPANLIYTIQQSASLRDSILAWLQDDVRPDYQRYVFPGTLPNPWTIAEFVVDSTRLVEMSGPLGLDNEVPEGNLFADLFEANVNALVELADRESVSNAESRWATFKRAGWMLFSAVLPFLGRTVGIAVWIWQILDDLQTLIEAREQGKKLEQWAALTDVLLNLGMAITLHVASRSKPATLAKVKRELPTLIDSPAKVPIIVKKLADLPSHELPKTHSSSLNTVGALNQTVSRLGTLLDSFKVTRPQGLSDASTEAGAQKHLHSLAGKWYAGIKDRWFEVQADENTGVRIIDSNQPDRLGPYLIHDAKGTWYIDARLRLRGGAGDGVVALEKKARTKALQKARELRTELTAFEKNKKLAQDQLQQTRQALPVTPGTSADAKRTLYLDTLKSQSEDYESALQKLKSLQVFSPVPDYQPRALNYLKAQLDLTQAGISEAQVAFAPKFRTVLDQIVQQAESPQTRHIDDASEMSKLIRDMITRLDFVESRFVELRQLGRNGLELIRTTRALMPSYSVDQLKALQVSLSRNLCLAADSTLTATEAWTTLDQIVDRADLAIQCLTDALWERSESRLDERIDILNSLFQQFNVIDNRLEDFQQEYPAQVLEQPLSQLREEIKGFRQKAMTHLGMLLTDRSLLRSRPSPRPTPPRIRQQIIRTRYNGVLIGTPRLTAQGLETEWVDITSPLTDKVIATFHEKPKGVWVRHVETAQPAAQVPDLDVSIIAGQAVLDELPAFNTRITEKVGQPGRDPSGIEFLIHQHILRLKNASQTIEQALTNANLTESADRESASTVAKGLSNAVDKLYEQAHGNMLKMIKEQPPTSSGLEWLNTHDELVIEKTVKRRRLKGPSSIYLDEYTIKERKTQKVLWYAHFHYSASWTKAALFIFARLKTPAEQKLGLAGDIPTGLSDAQLTAFYRGEIGLDQAERLFFSL